MRRIAYLPTRFRVSGVLNCLTVCIIFSRLCSNQNIVIVAWNLRDLHFLQVVWNILWYVGGYFFQTFNVSVNKYIQEKQEPFAAN
jgi:hypothetical protein